MIINLSLKELDAVLWAVGQFTTGNACDIKQMKSDGLSTSGAEALIRAHQKLIAAKE